MAVGNTSEAKSPIQVAGGRIFHFQSANRFHLSWVGLAILGRPRPSRDARPYQMQGSWGNRRPEGMQRCLIAFRWLGLAWYTYLVFFKDVMEILASSFFSNLKVVIGFLVVLCVLIKILKD